MKPKSSLWETARFFALIQLCAFGSVLASQILTSRGSATSVSWLCKCMMVMVSVSALTTYFLRRAGETWARYGVEWTPRAAGNAMIGMIGGLVLGCAWAASVWLQAPFRMKSNPGVNAVHLIFAVIATFAIGIGIAEEAGYRSYGMEQARKAGGPGGALIIPTSIFVLAHIAGGVPWQAALLVVGTCSILYGALMMATRSLPLVAAFHIGNNLVQDWVLRASNDSLWQVHFQDISTAEHSSMRMWWGIASLNVAMIALIAWRRKTVEKKLHGLLF